MLKALLFDLDGTLSETNSPHFPTWADAIPALKLLAAGAFLAAEDFLDPELASLIPDR